MFAALLPKTAPFFEMLLEQNKYLCQISEQIFCLFDGNEEARQFTNKRIAELEFEADVLYRRLTRSLSQTFITPIDREDILRIAQGQEECIDRMQSLATRLTTFGVKEIVFPARRLATILKDMFELTEIMLQGLTKRHDCHKTRVFRNLREECDTILAVGVAEIMDTTAESNKEMLNILQWIQIYDRMEVILTRVTELMESIEEAVLKNV